MRGALRFETGVWHHLEQRRKLSLILAPFITSDYYINYII